VRFVIREAAGVACDLLLRVPTWATGYEIDAPGAEINFAAGYLRVRKVWQTGDEIHLHLGAKIELVRAANGEYTVRRGPLQYALPISHVRRPYKDYGVAGFHDYELMPEVLEQAYVTPILDEGQKDWGCDFVRCGPVRDRPWDDSPVTIRLGEFSLVPLGCTVLRRSTLPLRATMAPPVGG
jgi:hypothetical protein